MKTVVEFTSIDELDFEHIPTCDLTWGYIGIRRRNECKNPAKWWMKFTCCGISGYCCDPCKKQYENLPVRCHHCGQLPLAKLSGF